MEDKKDLSLNDLQKQIDDVNNQIIEKDEKIKELEKQLEDSKLKIAQYSIAGLSRKVEEPKEEPIEFDFDF